MSNDPNGRRSNGRDTLHARFSMLPPMDFHHLILQSALVETLNRIDTRGDTCTLCKWDIAAVQEVAIERRVEN